MSEPKRYQPVVQCVEPSYQAQMIEPKVMEFSEGEYVLHSDYARLKGEVERLTSDIQMEKENEDRLVREWQKANNEVYGLKTQVAALIDDQTRLKAECQARQAENSVLAVECDSLKAQVERLTKAGDALAGKAISLEYNDYWSEYEKVEDVCIDEVEAWHKAKEGKQS